nr:PREDICTED: glycine-rich protein HC1-like [Daucus carota subsp. sativus]
MGSKISLLLGLSIAFALLMNSDVTARELVETATKNTGRRLLDNSIFPRPSVSYPGGGGNPYYNRNPYYGGCYYSCYGRCCSEAEAKALKATTTQVKPHN